jgi:hypothetical protein
MIYQVFGIFGLSAIIRWPHSLWAALLVFTVGIPCVVLGVHNWTQTGKGAHIRTLCQKNKGPVKVEQGPIVEDGGSTHRSLPSKRTPFQDGTGE